MFRSFFLIFSILVFLIGCGDLSWKPPEPGTVMAELTNSDKSATARVIATNVQGSYIFEIRGSHKGEIIANQIISAPVGYHEHNVSITWNDGSCIFSCIIDHDFGEGNEVFEIRTIDSGA